MSLRVRLRRAANVLPLPARTMNNPQEDDVRMNVERTLVLSHCDQVLLHQRTRRDDGAAELTAFLAVEVGI